MRPRSASVVLLPWAVGCAPGAGPLDTAAPSLDAGMGLGEAVHCAAPVDGGLPLRDIAADAGVGELLPETAAVFGRDMPGTGGGVAIADLDVDGDLDLLIGGLDGAPDLYVNDGAARFAHRRLDLPGAEGAHALHIADMDGDAWPDLVAFGARGGGGVYRNAGGLAFERVASFQAVEGVDDAVVMTGLIGDLDQDGDLDIAMPTMGWAGQEAAGQEAAEQGAPDLLLVQDAPLAFSRAADLVGPHGETLSQVGWLSDRDEDGDLDLLVLPDQGPRAAWWRSEGGLPAVEDADQVGGGLQMAAMGLDSADIDGDGHMDVCISDVGTPRCLLGQPDGLWVDATAVTALPVDAPLGYGPAGDIPTIGWSIALVDLDADGHLDLLQASGPEGGAASRGYHDIGDMLWKGRGELVFEDRAHASGFWDEAAHVGLATGDLDGDGFLEVVRAGPGRAPRLHAMPCTGGAWLQLRLAGPAADTMGFGTRITVEAGGRVWREEVLGLRDKAQGAPWQTIGLGNVDTVDRVVVQWLDGTRQVAHDVPTRRVLDVAHPDAVVPAPYPAE